MTLKVIYVSFGRLTDKMARDVYIDFLISKGAHVEYWDVVALVREEHAESNALQPAYLRVFRSLAELDHALCAAENRDAVYLMLMTYAGRMTRIFRLLSRHRCRMSYFAWGVMPNDVPRDWRRIAAWAVTPGRLAREIFHRARARFLRSAGLVAPFDIVFAAGAAAIAASTYALRVAPINYFDYDDYVKARAQGPSKLVSGRYAVFLDSNFPYHSDLVHGGYPRIDAESYYRSLNRFFGALERSYDVQVVVAAHPRADYAADRFEGRAIHRLATAELVRDCEFVLSHCSTAMSYAVLNNKPIVFIYTAEIGRAYWRSLMRSLRIFATYLDAPVCNVDEPLAGERLTVRPVNMQRYASYKYAYLTSPQSENTSTRDIVWRELSACANEAAHHAQLAGAQSSEA